MIRIVASLTAVLASTLGALPAPPADAGRLPRPDHVVLVVEENHEYKVLPLTPYLRSLARTGAKFTQSYGVTHPSEPNYLAMFSGSTQGRDANSCAYRSDADNLGNQLLSAGFSFATYAEGLPEEGFLGCKTDRYVKWVNPSALFTDIPSTSNLPFSRFPADFAALPAFSFVAPNLWHDMHNEDIPAADAWLYRHFHRYVPWTAAHNSLLIVTFDEDDLFGGNHILTVFVGPMVKPGRYAERITHYNLLRTLEDMYGLPCLGEACTATPITDIWR